MRLSTVQHHCAQFALGLQVSRAFFGSRDKARFPFNDKNGNRVIPHAQLAQCIFALGEVIGTAYSCKSLQRAKWWWSLYPVALLPSEVLPSESTETRGVKIAPEKYETWLQRSKNLHLILSIAAVALVPLATYRGSYGILAGSLCHAAAHHFLPRHYEIAPARCESVTDFAIHALRLVSSLFSKLHHGILHIFAWEVSKDQELRLKVASAIGRIIFTDLEALGLQPEED